MFSLPPAAQEVLRQYKAGMLVPQLLPDLTEDEVHELHHAERDFDARGHAEWAGQRLGELLKRRNEAHHLETARLWAYTVLARKYLVQPDWQTHAYETALKFARAR